MVVSVDWDELGIKWQTDKATTGPRGGLGHGYLEHYQRVLEGFPVSSVLEIGVQSAGSLFLWHELWPDARVCGIDIDPDCGLISGPFEIVVGDAGDPEAMAPLDWWRFDLIIDDGSHAAAHTEANMDVWAPRLNPGGVYVVEDAVFGSTSWIQSVEEVIPMLLRHGLTPFTIERGQMEWVAHQRYGGMMGVVFAAANCEIPE